ncbi:hypothetical protein CITRIK5_70296 [Citricoccus sp. K5]|nr:hypothetical protein CITRIK5_70296 [Citricoccus sp. K5]
MHDQPFRLDRPLVVKSPESVW